MISTQQVFEYVKSLELTWTETEKLIQELAWRDYWQQVWIAKGDEIHTDLKNPQTPVFNHQIPKAIIDANTGIDAVDSAIRMLYETGYMHNHMRMYVASICCNIAQSHWLEPARWMYSHLLDGDLASNQLSWQWVAGAFSNKKYYANQDNINRFFRSTQKKTFLDVEYDQFEQFQTPNILKETTPFHIDLTYPISESPSTFENQATLIYNYYNIDPSWHEGNDVQRILLFEPSLFERHPISQKSLDFALELSSNISGMKVYVGEFPEILNMINPEFITYKEHPLNSHYQGKEEPRNWMSSVQGYYPSFFAFWKKCKKELTL